MSAEPSVGYRRSPAEVDREGCGTELLAGAELDAGAELVAGAASELVLRSPAGIVDAVARSDRTTRGAGSAAHAPITAAATTSATERDNSWRRGTRGTLPNRLVALVAPMPQDDP
jgi:hypothetical protein